MFHLTYISICALLSRLQQRMGRAFYRGLLLTAYNMLRASCRRMRAASALQQAQTTCC